MNQEKKNNWNIFTLTFKININREINLKVCKYIYNFVNPHIINYIYVYTHTHTHTYTDVKKTEQEEETFW